MNKIPLCAVAALLLAIAGACGDDSTPRKPEVPANSWVNLKPSGIRPALPGWETLHHCPVSAQAVVWGDYRTFSTEYQHSLLGYDINTNRWHVLDASPYHETDLTPTCGHDFSGSVVDKRHGWLLLPECFPAYGPSHRYIYDLLGRCGRIMHGPGGHPYGINGALAYAPDEGLVLSCQTDTRATLYNPVTRQSEAVELPAELHNRHYSRLVYARHEKSFYFFGGSKKDEARKPLNDLWRLDLGTKKWKRLEPEGERPPAHSSPQLVYNDRYGVLMNLIWDKPEEKSPISITELWVYLPDANRWRKEKVAGVPKNGTTSYVSSSWTIYDPQRDVVLTTAVGSHALKDTWALRYVPSDRKPLPAPKTPVARRMELPKPVALERWHKAECLNASPAAPVVMSTALAAGKDRTFLAWDEDQSALYVREWNGSTWSAAAKVGESHMQPALTVLENRPFLASWSAGWSRSLHVLDGQDGKWQPLWSGDKDSKEKARPFQPTLTLHKKALHLATIAPRWDLEVWRSADGKWTQLGGSLNIKGVGSAADFGHINKFSLISCGDTLYCAWGEYWSEKTGTSWHVFVKKWDEESKSWVRVGGGINDPKTGFASRPELVAGPDGQPWITYLERRIEGTQHGPDRVFVKRLDGDRWVSVGSGSLNAFEQEGNAWSPRLALVGNDICVAWPEYRIGRPIVQEAGAEYVLYDRPQVFFARWDGKTWQREGPLNADLAEGSAAYVSLATSQGRPVVAWAEARGMYGPRMLYARVGK